MPTYRFEYAIEILLPLSGDIAGMDPMIADAFLPAKHVVLPPRLSFSRPLTLGLTYHGGILTAGQRESGVNKVTCSAKHGETQQASCCMLQQTGVAPHVDDGEKCR